MTEVDYNIMEATRRIVESIKSEISRYQQKIVEGGTERSQLLEQVKLYKGHVNQFKKAQVCSLKQYREARLYVEAAELAVVTHEEEIQRAVRLLKEEEEKLSQYVADLKRQEAIAAQYGRIYRFPSRDD
jgi:hypothetical protein